MEEPVIISQEQIPEKDVKPELSLSEWIFERIRPYVGGRILEIDNGEGKMAQYCRELGAEVNVMPLDLLNTTFDATHTSLTETFDLVIAIHPAKEMSLNPKIITNLVGLLKKEGYLAIHIPLSTALYEGLNEGYWKWKKSNRLYMYKLFYKKINLIKLGYYLITDIQPLISKHSVNFRTRVNIFSSVMATCFDQKGLCAIVIGQNAG